MIQWKGHLPAGKVYNNPVISLDIHPTAMAAVGGSIPAGVKLDGVNLLPYLTGSGKGIPHDKLYWRYGAQWAVRSGDWKLLSQSKGDLQLYNLTEDIGEKNNLVASRQDKVKELQATYDAWNKQLVDPRWVSERGTRKQRRKKKE